MHILDLPAELLYQIIDLCRPDGFESCLLTCKTILSIGSDLIEDHAFCKKWVSRTGGDRKESKHKVFHDLFEILESWMELPPRRRTSVFRYIKQIEVTRYSEHSDVYNMQKLFIQLKEEEPSYLQLFQKLLQQVWNIEPYCETHGQPRIRCILGIEKEQQRTCLERYNIAMNPLEEVHRSFVPEMFDSVGLGILPNLQSLILSVYGHDLNTSNAPGICFLASRDLNKLCYQHLRELYIRSQWIPTLDDAASLLELPLLETLIMDKLRDGDTADQDGEETHFSTQMRTKSPLKRLVFFDAKATPERLGQFLTLISRLEVFFWEAALDPIPSTPSLDELQSDSNLGEDQHIPLDAGDAVDWDDSDDAIDDVVASRWSSRRPPSPLIIYESVDDIDGVEFNDPTRSMWKPADIFGQIFSSHGNSLRRLTIKCSPSLSDVKSSDRIVDFQGCTSLTHIEYDESIVRKRSRRIYKDSADSKHLPASPHSVLPASIKVVIFTIYLPSFNTIHEMLRGLLSFREQFSKLRLIYIQISIPALDELEYLLDDLKSQMEDLIGSFLKVGIVLKCIGECYDDGIFGKIDTDCHDHGFFNHNRYSD
jgi:hypothetical protein